MFSKNKESAITLIALVITIIVLLILAGVSIAMLTGTNGILTQAQKSKMTTELSSYKEQLELYKTEKLSENREFLESTLTVGKESLTYNTQPTGETGNIKTVIPSIKDEYIDKIEVIKGALLINTQDKNEIEIAKSLGIAANPYDIVNGELLSSNGNLLLMDETGTLTIPDSVTKIGEGAFANLEGLKTIIIPGTVKEIGTNAFAYNQTLEKVIIEDGVKIIGDSAFKHCGNLKEVKIAETVTELGKDTFSEDSNMEMINIPAGVKTIKYAAFYNCKNIKKIIFPKSLEKIENWAFRGTTFSSVSIPATVIEIMEGAFDQNLQLSDIKIEGEDQKFVYENGMLMPKNRERILFIAYQYLSNMQTLTIPEGVKSIDITMGEEKNITKLIIPSSLESISPSNVPRYVTEIEVASNNQNLAVSKELKILYNKKDGDLISCYSKDENINLKDEENTLNIKKIREYAFSAAINAKYVTLPETTTTICDYAFSRNNKIININIGSNVSTINGGFKELQHIGTLTINQNNSYYIVENDILYNKDKTKLCAILGELQGEYTVKNNVKEIEYKAFTGQDKLTKINFSQGIEKIGTNSFFKCTGLQEVNIPNSIKVMGTNVFDFCDQLSKININISKEYITGAPWGAPKGMKVVNWNG